MVGVGGDGHEDGILRINLAHRFAHHSPPPPNVCAPLRVVAVRFGNENLHHRLVVAAAHRLRHVRVLQNELMQKLVGVGGHLRALVVQKVPVLEELGGGERRGDGRSHRRHVAADDRRGRGHCRSVKLLLLLLLLKDWVVARCTAVEGRRGRRRNGAAALAVAVLLRLLLHWGWGPAAEEELRGRCAVLLLLLVTAQQVRSERVRVVVSAAIVTVRRRR